MGVDRIVLVYLFTLVVLLAVSVVDIEDSGVGGEARRGDLTDRFVTISAAAANYLIVVADGNKDGFMTNAAGGAPLDMADTVGDAGRFLKAAYK